MKLSEKWADRLAVLTLAALYVGVPMLIGLIAVSLFAGGWYMGGRCK